MYYCPICKKKYEISPNQCDCGYKGIEYYDYYNDNNDQQLFRIYKFTKNVVNQKIDYTKDRLFLIENDDIMIDSVEAKRGLTIVEMATDHLTIATKGILALNRNVYSLIINTTVIDPEFLDESIVQILFLGNKVTTLDYITRYSLLRYIHVDKRNNHFTDEAHVLFDKKKHRLIHYANQKKEKEYYVPKSVKIIAPYAFYNPKHLQKIYLPKDVYLENQAITGNIEIKYY